MKTYAVIMAGGSGKRLWPLSSPKRPKQFIRVTAGESLLMNTIRRMEAVADPADILIVGSEKHREALIEQTDGVLPDGNILFEPMGRNTTACIALAGLFIERRAPGVMCIVPADHYIKDVSAFQAVLRRCVDAAKVSDSIVTLGIAPDRPATEYGYIRYDGARPRFQGGFHAERFFEKPDAARAREYIAGGNYVWNGGIFVAKSRVMLDKIRTHMPELYRGCEVALDKMIKGDSEGFAMAYDALESISIDYSVMEKSDDLIVFPADCGWNDIGSFESLGNILPADSSENSALADRFVAIDSKNCTAFTGKKLVAFVGVEDLVAVETRDVLLLIKKGDSKRIGEVLREIPDLNIEEME